MAVNSFREDEKLQNENKSKIISRLFSYLKNYKLGVLGVLLCMGITIAIKLVNPLLIESAIDDYIAVNDYTGLYKIGIIAIIINVIYIMMVKVRMYVMSLISNKILLEIRQELYIHIQKLSFSFFDSRPTGKILARIIGDVNSLKQVLSNSVTVLIPDFITVVGVVAIMLAKDVKLTLASLCTIPLMIVAIFIIQTVGHKRWMNFRKKVRPEKPLRSLQTSTENPLFLPAELRICLDLLLILAGDLEP